MSTSFSEHAQQEHDEVEEKLEKVGSGYTKEMASKFGSTLAHNIISIDVNHPGLEESKYGRKLYTTVTEMIKHGGDIFKSVIEAAYPLELFLQKKDEKIAELELLAEESERIMKLDLTAPVDAEFRYSADLEIEDETFKLEAQYEKEIKEVSSKEGKKRKIQMTLNHH
jgi:hypothetical protein